MGDGENVTYESSLLVLKADTMCSHLVDLLPEQQKEYIVARCKICIATDREFQSNLRHAKCA